MSRGVWITGTFPYARFYRIVCGVHESRFSWKELILGLLTAAFGIISFRLWYGAFPALVSGNFEAYVHFIPPVASLLVAATVFSLTGLLVKNRWILYASGLLATLTPVFFVSIRREVAVISLIVGIITFYGLYKIKKEIKLSLGFNVSKALRVGLPLYFTVTSLLLSLFYLDLIDEKQALTFFLPKSVFQITLRALTSKASPLSGLLSGLPEINPETTVDELLNGFVEKELQSQGLSGSQIPKKELAKLLALQREELIKTYGLTLKGNERVGEIFYETVSARIVDLFGPYRSYLPIASAVAFFLAIKTFTLPLYFLTILFAALLIKVLIFANIIVNKKEQIEVDRLTLN